MTLHWIISWCWWFAYPRLRGKQGPAQAVHVAEVHLDAGVGEAQLVEAGGVVPGTDVALTGEWRDSDGVFKLWLGQVVADPTVYVPLQAQETVKRQQEVLIR